MSSKSVDLIRLTIDDIFRAKEERRKRLASLPFDQKIQIVNKLRTLVRDIKGEKAIFASFLRACPKFADEPIKEWDVVDEWYTKRALTPPAHPFDHRPDIIAITKTGKKIGIELKSWLNEAEIKEARGAYSPDRMWHTLSSTLKARRIDRRYDQELRRQAKLDELYLLIHYDSRTLAYNEPFAGAGLGFKEAAEFASNTLAGNGGNFDRVFLSYFVLDHEEAIRIV